MEYDYEYFKWSFLTLSGINLNYYKEKQMKRRIETLMARWGFTSYREFIRTLRMNQEKYAYFLDYITINVTEFFRTPEHWQFFEQEIIPDLVAQFGPRLDVWSVACATGEEPYSLAMSFGEYLSLNNLRILATDLDEPVLTKARLGYYSGKLLESIPESMLGLYFNKVGNGYQANRSLRSCINFRRMDILKEPFPQKCHLIVCRNVLIYFTEEAKEKLFQNFYTSLVPGGYLFTGNTEQLLAYKQLGFTKIKSYLYQKEK